MAFGDNRSEILVVDHDSAALLRIDVNTGDREVIIDAFAGGYPPVEPMRLAYDKDNRILYWSELEAGVAVVRSVHLDWETPVGLALTGNAGDYAGPELEGLSQGIAMTDKGRLLYLDSVNDSVVEVDLSTGDKRLVASSVSGSGASTTVSSRALEYAPEWEAALVMAEGHVYIVDLESGAKVTLPD
ncbi:hypothetical protein [Marinimicrobium locisalis]|uniref:hypothetical protein n=1 Tax=Marinimicrobium locisalis TaxID=546022 RepID=UPI0032221F35